MITSAATTSTPAANPKPDSTATALAAMTSDDDVGEYDAEAPAGPGEGIEDDDADPGIVDADADLDADTTSETADGEPADESAAPVVAASPDVEEVEITDHRGRRSVKVDFSDRARLKRIIQQAAGAQKLVADLKTLRASVDSAKGDAEVGSRVSKAWSEKGIDGLIQELTGGKQTWDSVYEDRKKHDNFLSTASPEQLDAYSAKQEAAAARAEAARIRADLDDGTKKSVAAAETAERAQLQTHMDSGFTKHRFAGKLGEPAREHELDEMLWDATKAALDKLPEDAAITSEVIAAEFAKKARALRATISTEARKETTQIVKQKKTEAKTQAQAAMSAAESKSPVSQFDQKLKKGDLRGAFLSALRGSRA